MAANFRDTVFDPTVIASSANRRAVRGLSAVLSATLEAIRVNMHCYGKTTR